MPRHRHPHQVPPHELEGHFGPPHHGPHHGPRHGRHPLPPHLRAEMDWPWLDARGRRLMQQILDSPEQADAAAEILSDAPPEFAALAALVLGVFEKLSRAEA